MRKLNDSRKETILSYIDEHYSRHKEIPTVREIAEGTGIATTSVHRYLNALNETGELEYNGHRGISTRRMDMETEQYSMPVLGYVACGAGEEEQGEIIEYIRMPESLVGKGEFFALIAKGESMINAGVNPGDYVIVRKQNTANVGQLVVALYENLNNLKKLMFDEKTHRYILRSCNDNKKKYPDIIPENLQVQGVAVCVVHKFE